MADKEGINLPNGRFVELAGIPDNVSKAELQDKLIRNGLATIEEFKTAETPEELNWLEKNMELPVGMGGALAGAGAGFLMGGPVGMVIGGVLGGSAGSGAGSLISNELADEELDYAEAAQEALISAGFDIATLGLGRVLKPGWYAARAALGYTPKEVAEEAVKIARQVGETVPKAGTRESLQASQEILQSADVPASLTVSQTGQATGFQKFKEKIGELGILSSAGAVQNAEDVSKAAKNALQEIMDRPNAVVGASSTAMGEALLGVINAGKQGLSDVYGQGLDEIRKDVSRKTVPTAIIKTKLKRFLDAGQRKTFSIYSDPTKKYVNELIENALSTEKMTARTLLDLDKKISTDIKAFGDVNSGVYNDVAARELGSMVDVLKSSFINTLKTVDPKTAKKYETLKSSYSAGRKALLPVVNKTFVQNASDEGFASLGRLVTGGTRTDSVKALFKSVDESFAQIKKAGGESTGVFKTAADAKKAISSGFLQNTLPKLQDEAFDITSYAKLADEFNKPDQNAMLKLVTGADYGRVKQIFNLMSEASTRPDGNIGSLVLRGKEFGVLGNVGQYVAGAGVSAFGGLAGMLTAGAVLFAPVFFEKAARNPKAVNKLLAFEKTNFKNDAAKEKAVSLIISEVMDGLSTEEQAEIRNALR
jgi:hypothetical protein